MDEDRKYRQRGYMDNDRERRDTGSGPPQQKPRGPQGPRTLQDPNGPRLPRLVQSVTASRCFNCSTTLAPGTDYVKDVCPKCGTSLHCCKQCSHFEPSTRFQCVKPIPARIPYKDKSNECELFSPKVSVMRDGPPHTAASSAPAPAPDTVRTPNDARAAFDSLFKK